MNNNSKYYDETMDSARQHFASGDFQQTIDWLSRAIDFAPTEETKANAFCSRGIAYSVIGKHTMAIEDFNKVIEYNSEDTVDYRSCGMAHMELSNHEEAINDYSKA